MGDNPSRFKGPDRPVESVSWDDVQGFLRRSTRWCLGWTWCCRRRRSGSMPAGRGPRRRSALARRSRRSRSTTTATIPMPAARRVCTGKRPFRLPACLLIPGVFTRCMATSGSGVPTGTRSYTTDAVTDPMGPTRPRRGPCAAWRLLGQRTRRYARSAYRLREPSGRPRLQLRLPLCPSSGVVSQASGPEARWTPRVEQAAGGGGETAAWNVVAPGTVGPIGSVTASVVYERSPSAHHSPDRRWYYFSYSNLYCFFRGTRVSWCFSERYPKKHAGRTKKSRRQRYKSIRSQRRQNMHGTSLALRLRPISTGT